MRNDAASTFDLYVLNSTREFECFAGKRAEYYLDHLYKNTTCGYEYDPKRTFTGQTVFPSEDEHVSIYDKNLFSSNMTHIQVLIDNPAEAPLYIDLRSELVYTPNDSEFLWMIGAATFALLLLIVLACIGLNINKHMKKIRELENRKAGSQIAGHEPLAFESPGR